MKHLKLCCIWQEHMYLVQFSFNIQRKHWLLAYTIISVLGSSLGQNPDYIAGMCDTALTTVDSLSSYSDVQNTSEQNAALISSGSFAWRQAYQTGRETATKSCSCAFSTPLVVCCHLSTRLHTVWRLCPTVRLLPSDWVASQTLKCGTINRCCITRRAFRQISGQLIVTYINYIMNKWVRYVVGGAVR